MNPDHLDHLLKNLEQGADDELSELESVGASFYPTGQLLRLRGQWEIKSTLFKKFQRFFVGAVATSVVWLILWECASSWGYPDSGSFSWPSSRSLFYCFSSVFIL